MYDDDAREQRRESARRRLGDLDPHCPECGENDPLALTGITPTIRCYECQALTRGRPWLERQHPAGQANHPLTVPIPGNDHRVVDDRKNDWPPDTLRNPAGSPLLKAAACLRGWLDTLALVVERTVGWIPVWLEGLDRWLVDTLGRRWWAAMPGELLP